MQFRELSHAGLDSLDLFSHCARTSDIFATLGIEIYTAGRLRFFPKTLSAFADRNASSLQNLSSFLLH